MVSITYSVILLTTSELNVGSLIHAHSVTLGQRNVSQIQLPLLCQSYARVGLLHNFCKDSQSWYQIYVANA